jgi:hypothetical protein
MQVNPPNEVAEQLVHYCHNVLIIQKFYSLIEQDIGHQTHGLRVAPPYLNFRDALFHFTKMIDAKKAGDEAEYIGQQKCIDEHLNRGIADFINELSSNFYVKVIHDLLRSESELLTKEREVKLRKQYHFFKNVMLGIRIEGQKLVHFDDTSRSILFNKIISQIDHFHKKTLGADNALQQLYRQSVYNIFGIKGTYSNRR